MIIGCYRRDEATDPEIFASALALIFQEYEREVIEYASDPRTGVITKFPMGLPQVPQIREFLEQTVRDRAHRARYATLPRYQQNRDALPKPELPVLFVADFVNGYEKMWQKHNDTQGKFSRAETRLCAFDQQRHAGLWVPTDWWLAR
jgi:hypothetical protein